MDAKASTPKDEGRADRPASSSRQPRSASAREVFAPPDSVSLEKWNDPAALAHRLAELANLGENHAVETLALRAGAILSRDGPALPLTSVSDLQGVEIQMPPVLIEGILREEEVMIFAGESKIGKTWLALSGAHAIATGGEWLGQKCAAGAVGYLNFEIDSRVMNFRAQRVSERAGAFPSNLHLAHMRGQRADIPALMPDLVAKARECHWKAIFIDALYNALGDRDENNNGDMAELMHELTALAVETKCAVIVIHHFNKSAHGGRSGGAVDGNQMSGAGSLMRAPESIVTVTRIRSEDTEKYDLDDAMVNLRVAASLRTFADLDPFAISRDPKSAEITRHAFSLREKDKSERERKNAKKKDKEGRPQSKPTIPELISWMGDREFRPGQFNKEGAEFFGVSVETMKRRREEAEGEEPSAIVSASRGLIRAAFYRKCDAVGSKGSEVAE